MKNLTYPTHAGDNFPTVSKKAKEWATEKNRNVEFEFNGVLCIVSKQTNLDWLYRDYCNAHTMEWKTVGADCTEAYSIEVQAELDKRNKLAQEEYDKSHREYEIKEKFERDAFKKKTFGVEIELADSDEWLKGKGKNMDAYGGATYEYAESWAKLMQVEMTRGKSLIECAEKTSFELGFLGITGFMYGCAVQILSRCWKHGEELRKWHNKEYGHEGKGVVNPAVLTIGSK